MHPKKCLHYIENKKLHSSIGKKMDDEKYVKRMFKLTMGYELDLENPKTYNEKLQWLKLNYRNPECVIMVDKYLAKDYVKRRIGEEYVVPLYGVWDKFDDIDFDSLPNQFVLKTTHDCGGVVVCKDKSTLDKEKAKKFLNKHLAREYFYHCREWAYKQVKPRILAEKFMKDSAGQKEEGLTDYKFFCFDGQPKAMFIATDRAKQDTETKFDFYDMEFNHLPFTNGHPNSDKIIQKPKQFDLMVELSKKLSQGLPHVRVDFYESEGRIYFGELTFFHWGGFVPFEPKEWDYKFGEWIKLS
ncbi:MAG: glycosyl transferase [Clostridia bacterium]|nr:glycosyl transferase [Clostridia bacterium]